MSRRIFAGLLLVSSGSLGLIGCDEAPSYEREGFDSAVFVPPRDSGTPTATPDAAQATPDAAQATPDTGSGPRPGDAGSGGADSTTPLPTDSGAMDSATGDAATGDAATGDAATGDAATGSEAGANDGGSADTGPTGDASLGDAGPVTGGACLNGITNYQAAGPFKFTTRTSGAMKFWVPTVPAGCKVPIIHLANGTTANCGNYQGALERTASHGFLTACYEDTNTGAGAFGVTAFETALSMFPDLADNKLGSTGHSQGGQAAIVTMQLAEEKWGNKMIYAGLAMEPASGYGTQPVRQTWQQSYAKVKGPIFMYSGDSSTGFSNSSLLGFSTGDGLVAISWVTEGFNALADTIEAYHWTAVGATHIPTPVEPQQQVSIPWFRWKLLGDKAACEFFKKMPTTGGKWKVQKEQNPKACE